MIFYISLLPVGVVFMLVLIHFYKGVNPPVNYQLLLAQNLVKQIKGKTEYTLDSFNFNLFVNNEYLKNYIRAENVPVVVPRSTTEKKITKDHVLTIHSNSQSFKMDKVYYLGNCRINRAE